MDFNISEVERYVYSFSFLINLIYFKNSLLPPPIELNVNKTFNTSCSTKQIDSKLAFSQNEHQYQKQICDKQCIDSHLDETKELIEQFDPLNNSNCSMKTNFVIFDSDTNVSDHYSEVMSTNTLNDTMSSNNETINQINLKSTQSIPQLCSSVSLSTNFEPLVPSINDSCSFRLSSDNNTMNLINFD